MAKARSELIKGLNRVTRATDEAKLGDIVGDLLTAHNALVVKHNALLAKLDLDAGVTDTNYNALLTASASTVVDLGSR